MNHLRDQFGSTIHWIEYDFKTITIRISSFETFKIELARKTLATIFPEATELVTIYGKTKRRHPMGRRSRA